MKTSLDILEQKIKDRMKWLKAQYVPFQYKRACCELKKVLKMIEEVRKDGI